jgi:hypothetical protein
MGHRVFQKLSFASRPQSPERERSEPRLLASDPPLPFRRPVPPDPAVLSAARDDAMRPAIAPITAASDRNPIAPAVQGPNSLRLIAVAGCILFAVAGVGSAAFLLFANPAKEIVGAASPTNPSAAPQTGQSADSPSLGAEDRHPAETRAAASPPSAPPRPAMNDAALKSPSGLPLVSPPSPINPPPSGAVTPAKPVAKGASDRRGVAPSLHRADLVAVRPQSAGHPGAAEAGDQHTLAAAEAAADRRATSGPQEAERVSRVRHAERHAHPRAARQIRTSTAQTGSSRSPRPHSPDQTTRVAGPGPAQHTDQPAQFNELLAHLTGSATPAGRPSGQSLTPPTPGAPDPFDAIPRGDTSHQ